MGDTASVAKLRYALRRRCAGKLIRFMRSLVSIIVPAHNADASLARTIRSAQAQTWPDIEIVIVNDGSSDGTADIIASLADADRRIVSITQPNAGVAAARNAGMMAARGEFIAPLDADDIWHPTKIARQMSIFEDCPPDVGLVYNWFRRIDSSDVVLGVGASPRIDGWVFFRHLDWNFVSNGSTPLVRGNIARQTGYRSSLRALGNEGCEDYLFQLEIARRHRFAYVPEFLTGYRRTSAAMSTNTARMIRSHISVLEMMHEGADDRAKTVIRERIAQFTIELARHHLRRLDLRGGMTALRQALSSDPVAAIRHGWGQMAIAGRGASTDQRGIFDILETTDPGGLWTPGRGRHRLAKLEEFDRSCAR